MPPRTSIQNTQVPLLTSGLCIRLDLCSSILGIVIWEVYVVVKDHITYEERRSNAPDGPDVDSFAVAVTIPLASARLLIDLPRRAQSVHVQV